MTILNADRWLYETMTGDDDLSDAIDGQVYIDTAPEIATYPFLRITSVSLVPVSEVSAERIMDNELWQVSVFGNEPNYTSLEEIADAVRDLLHKASGDGVIGCVFEGARRAPDDEAGKQFKQIILEFRLFTQ